MITFSPLRTRRLSVRMRELSIGDAIALLSIPQQLNEAATTELLRKIVESAEKPTERHVTDPREWTVQERMFAVCHYLASTSEEGPDFQIGSGAHYSDYLDTKQDAPTEPILVGVVGGDEWTMRPLVGAAAECIEQLAGDMPKPITGRFHWILGAMASQMLRKGEQAPQYGDLPAYLEWMRGRMKTFAAYPESDFVQLLAGFMAGQERLKHFFGIQFNEDGVIALPAERKEAGAAELPPTRFPVGSCISDFAKGIAGKLKQ
jgi:hypothetical protein